MKQDPSQSSRRMSFLALIAWVSLCLILAGWFPQLGWSFGRLWVFVGLFGLVSAVGLAASVKAEVTTQTRLLESYINEARTDALTELANRRAFELELRRCEQDWRKNKPTSLLLIDVDNFKTFNDNHGHRAGDETLRAVAGLLKQSLPNDCLVTRYGGEEFAVVMPNTYLQEAKTSAETVRTAISDNEFSFREQILKLTVSIGVAEALPNESPDEFVNRADTALYLAKDEGRNCSCVHDGQRCRVAIHGESADSLPLSDPAGS